MSAAAVLILFLLCQFDFSSQSCNKCDGDKACDRHGKCKNVCIEGYYGDKCVKSCPENCRTCTDDITCTECHPGYSGPQCASKCGRGCVNNTCLKSGKCNCTSDRFVDEWCMSCINSFHGDDCDESCPPNCGSCLSNTHCTWCKKHRFYGSYCQFNCSEGCDNGTCIRADGTCTCKPSFTGAKCDSCVSGKHGPNCDLDCPGNCAVCLSNSNCTQCKPGYYGSTCTNICPSGCNESKCDIDGMCTNGCKPRFSSTVNCKICETGMWGDLCQYKCPGKCSSCKSNENCTKCINGYYGSECKKECPGNCLDSLCKHDGGCYSCNEHHFGYFCQSNCSLLCFDRNCSMVDGQCFSCPNGLEGNFCSYNSTTKKCKEGLYGNDCKYKCADRDGSCLSCLTDRLDYYGGCTECESDSYPFSSSGLNHTICRHCPEGCVNDTCDSKNGFCVHGCRNNTRYGNQCKQNCSKTCKNERCQWRTGHCTDGCVENYYGAFCKNECTTTCKSSENERRCNESTGKCNSCLDGYYGDMCDRNCSEKCTNGTCHKNTAECMHGCEEGYEGLQCTQAIKGPGPKDRNLAIIVGASVGGGVAVIIVAVVIAICITSKRKRKKTANRKENSGLDESLHGEDKSNELYVEDVDTEAVIYAQPDSPKIKNEKLGSEMYDTTFSNKNMDISKSNNEYDVFGACGGKFPHTNNGNREQTVGEGGNETYDTTIDNKNKNTFQMDNNYAELNTGRGKLAGTGKDKPNGDEDAMYDTAYHNKDKKMFKAENNYGVLSTGKGKLRDKGQCKPNGTDEDAADEMYDTAYEDKNKKIFKMDNDYDILNTGSKR